MKNEQSDENAKTELKNKDGPVTLIPLSQLSSWGIKHAEDNQGCGKAYRMKTDKKRRRAFLTAMKNNKKRTGAFLILAGIGLPLVLWFFFGEAARRGQFGHAALLSITDDVEIKFKYMLGTGALIVLWGIGLILSSFFPKKSG